VSGFLLDTNVVSELIKAKPEPRVAAWIEATDESLLYLSVLTLGEIRKGVVALADAARRVRLEAWLDHDLAIRFSGRILPIDLGVADRWGRICGSAAAKKSGVPKSGIPVIDALLAATALHYDLTLVTRDTSHARVSGAAVFDPWK